MTDWTRLAEPFDETEVKQRPGAATYEHKSSCDGPRCRETRDPAKHIQFDYIDARAVVRRLNDVVTPDGWEFTSTVIPGTDIVHGHLMVGGVVREDYGYPNSERDDEPIKAAASDSLKRCAVLFGIGLHLYDDNKSSRTPSRGTGRAQAPSPVRPAAAPARTSTDVPDEPDWMAPTTEPTPIHSDNSECPIHGVPWIGQWGDLWHKDEEGRYCRHPDNTRQERKAGARR